MGFPPCPVAGEEGLGLAVEETRGLEAGQGKRLAEEAMFLAQEFLFYEERAGQGWLEGSRTNTVLPYPIMQASRWQAILIINISIVVISSLGTPNWWKDKMFRCENVASYWNEVLYFSLVKERDNSFVS